MSAPRNGAQRVGAQRVGARNWAVLGLLGLSGQIAWNVENSWFNTFVYDTITPDPGPIAAMVAVSSIVATLTTLVAGAASDRIGRRKPFILVGYVLWAASTMAYPAAAWPRSVAVAVFLVIALDALMTFFGSMANDAAFNAWVTDVTVPGNRGVVEGFLAVLPVLAVVIGMGASGALIDRFGYEAFFLSLGGLVLAMGLGGGLLLREARPVPGASPQGSRPPLRTVLAHILSPAELKARRELYLVFAAMALYGIAYQVVAPYEIIYLNATLGISKSAVGVITAMVAPVLILFSLPIGRLTDRGLGFPVAVSGYVVAALGQAAFALTDNVVLLAVFAALKNVGFLMGIVLGAWHRDLVPDDARGAYQGVRLLFAVMIPMVAGPALGSFLIRSLGTPTTLNGAAGFVPPPHIYWVSAALTLAALVPLAGLRRLRSRRPSE